MTREKFPRADFPLFDQAVHDVGIVTGEVLDFVVGQEQQASNAVPTGAIVRHWSARATEGHLRKYLEHFSKNVLPELRSVPGFLGATLSVRRTAREAEISVETTWRSLEAIRTFAGADLEAAVVAPEAAALLTDFDRRVRHTEIAISASV